MAHEPVSSIDLMERASICCTEKIIHFFPDSNFLILCGPGNNGGDGLAIARLLKEMGRDVHVFHPGKTDLSPDNLFNLSRWTGSISNLEDFNRGLGSSKTVIVDALFGTGQNRPPDGIYKRVIEDTNNFGRPVIAIDIPSGMYSDKTSIGNAVILATYTLTFQVMKLAFLVPENGPNCGEVILLDIGLSAKYYEQTDCRFELTQKEDVRKIYKPRDKFAHKGIFGTALLFAGKTGMMGAAILASRACLRTGVGKLVCRLPRGGLDIMQVAIPEAICSPDEDPDCLTHLPPLDVYGAIGVGPGIGKDPKTALLVKNLMEASSQPLVIDADALNIIAEQKLQHLFRVDMVITPHMGEFQRLVGDVGDDFSRLKACLELSTGKQVCVILKGHYSFLSTPRGNGYFNSTGNAGMAKAGSGDVLTGMVTALIAQKYSVDEACRLGMFLHGAAGDLAKIEFGAPSYVASDMINQIGKALDSILL